MKKIGIYLGTIGVLTATALFMFFIIPTNSKSEASLQFTSQEEDGKQQVKELMDYIGVEYELSSSGDGWAVNVNGDISEERMQEVKRSIQSDRKLTFRDYKDRVKLTHNDLVAGSVVIESRRNNDQKVLVLEVKDVDKLANITEKISSYEQPNDVLAIWFGYEEDQSYLDEREKEQPAYLSAPRVVERLRTKKLQIIGNFTEEEFKDLRDKMNIAMLSENLKLVDAPE